MGVILGTNQIVRQINLLEQNSLHGEVCQAVKTFIHKAKYSVLYRLRELKIRSRQLEIKMKHAIKCLNVLERHTGSDDKTRLRRAKLSQTLRQHRDKAKAIARNWQTLQERQLNKHNSRNWQWTQERQLSKQQIRAMTEISKNLDVLEEIFEQVQKEWAQDQWEQEDLTQKEDVQKESYCEIENDTDAPIHVYAFNFDDNALAVSYDRRLWFSKSLCIGPKKKSTISARYHPGGLQVMVNGGIKFLRHKSKCKFTGVWGDTDGPSGHMIGDDMQSEYTDFYVFDHALILYKYIF